MTHPMTHTRWSFLRKREVLHSIESGTTTEEEALALHSISPEELAEWRTQFAARGLNGLKTTYRIRRSQCP